MNFKQRKKVRARENRRGFERSESFSVEAANSSCDLTKILYCTVRV